MGNIFDTARDAMFSTVTATMGYAATWLPYAGGEAQTAQVLYKDATEKDTIEEHEFNKFDFCIEWIKPFLPGLKESVDNGNAAEKITISLPTGDTDFYVQRVMTLADGATYKAYLQMVV